MKSKNNILKHLREDIIPYPSLTKQEIIDILENNILHPSASELADIPFDYSGTDEDLDLYGYYKTADEIMKKIEGQ